MRPRARTAGGNLPRRATDGGSGGARRQIRFASAAFTKFQAGSNLVSVLDSDDTCSAVCLVPCASAKSRFDGSGKVAGAIFLDQHIYYMEPKIESCACGCSSYSLQSLISTRTTPSNHTRHTHSHTLPLTDGQKPPRLDSWPSPLRPAARDTVGFLSPCPPPAYLEVKPQKE